MNLSLYYQLEIRDADGKIVRRTRNRRAKSLVANFIHHIRMAFANANASMLDTAGTSRTGDSPANTLNWMTIVSSSNTRGIVVGTGTTVVDIANHQLATIIGDGAGAGQLNHGSQTFGSVVVTSTQASFTIQRVFTNNSGASITVEECGIYCTTEDTGNVDRNFCLARDLTGSVVVPHQATLTVTYTLKVVE